MASLVSHARLCEPRGPPVGDMGQVEPNQQTHVKIMIFDWPKVNY